MSEEFSVGSVGTSAMPSVDHNSVYSQTFGNLKDKTAYVNHWQGVDTRENLNKIFSIGVKSLLTTTGGSGTAGNAMVPVYLDPRIVDISRKETPLVELIPRVSNMGLTADFNRLTAKGGGVTAAEDAALSDVSDTYVRVSKSIKYLYSVGRVTGQSQAAYPSFILQGLLSSGVGLGTDPFSAASAPNAMQLEVQVKAQAMKELEENLIINGNSGTDATQFDGIIVQQSTTNQTDKGTTPLTLDDIETSVRTAYDNGGRPNLAVCSSSVLQDIRKLMIDTYRFSPADMRAGSDLPFGISAQLVLQTLLGPIPVIPSRYMSNTSGSKVIYFLDMRWIEMRVLLDMTYQEFGQTNDSQKFMLKIYETLVLRAPTFNAFIKAIA